MFGKGDEEYQEEMFDFPRNMKFGRIIWKYGTFLHYFITLLYCRVKLSEEFS